MPVAPVARLYPGHVYLYESGAAPLASLEHDDTDGVAGQAVGLHHGGDASLRGVENEGYVGAEGLVLDDAALGAPVLEVVPAAQASPGGSVVLHEDVFGVLGHGAGYVCHGAVGVGCGDTYTQGRLGIAPERVGQGTAGGHAAGVFGENIHGRG